MQLAKRDAILVRHDFSFWSYFTQLTIAVAIPFIWEVFEEVVLRWSEVGDSPLGAVGIQLLNPSVILLLGFVLGYGTGVIRAGTNWNGIWVWCLPVLALVIAVSVLGGVDLHTIWVEYFYYAHPGVDEGPIGREFFTYPALSSVAYSLGCPCYQRRKR
jgi:hypothetical protein